MCAGVAVRNLTKGDLEVGTSLRFCGIRGLSQHLVRTERTQTQLVGVLGRSWSTGLPKPPTAVSAKAAPGGAREPFCFNPSIDDAHQWLHVVRTHARCLALRRHTSRRELSERALHSVHVGELRCYFGRVARRSRQRLLDKLAAICNCTLMAI